MRTIAAYAWEATTAVNETNHLDELQDLLSVDRAQTVDRISSLTKDVFSIVEAARLTATDDEHDSEGSTIAFERSLTSTLLAEATRHLAELDRALERINSGDYGHCERCGEPIALGRLLARPAARTCIRCAA